jgi:hypothetical protein
MNDLVAALDRGNAIAGEDIKLRRSVGVTNKAYTSVDIRAAVRSPTDKQLAAGFAQSDFFCIFSPTEIDAAQWPGGHSTSVTSDLRIPSKNLGDEMFIRGGWRKVEWGQGFYPGGSLCRIEVRALG